MTCFECRNDVSRALEFSIEKSYAVCWPCVRTIVAEHIKSTKHRETHINKRAEELADELGYRPNLEVKNLDRPARNRNCPLSQCPVCTVPYSCDVYTKAR